MMWSAVNQGDVELLRELVCRQGEQSLPVDKEGRSVLCRVAECGHLEMAQFLFELGIRQDACDDGKTPLISAANAGRLEMV